MGEVESIEEITVESLKAAIKAFIEERLQLKLAKLKDDQHEERKRLLTAHEPEVWLADAAHRAGQIRQVTHAIKFTHPDARGTNLFSTGNVNAGEAFVGTHSLGELLTPDAVGNAAALDVYKFLRLRISNTTLLELALAGDARLCTALSQDSEKAQTWMRAFACLVDAKGNPSSHTLAKQLYWPLGAGQYHLLAPLFPSSIVNKVWATQREHRFSEQAKAARAARVGKAAFAHGYHEYLNVVVQKYGGTKPQNISQLNSERHGENHLLPSVPPNWKSPEIRAPLFNDSVFKSIFGRRGAVRDALGELQSYLVKIAPINNLQVRQGRARRVQTLVDELLQFAAELGELEPGWSACKDCRLNIEEQCWLDPGRATNDEIFAANCRLVDWQDAVCQRFANWLNARLAVGSKGLPVGEDEAHEWHRLLGRELAMLHQELSIHD